MTKPILAFRLPARAHKSADLDRGGSPWKAAATFDLMTPNRVTPGSHATPQHQGTVMNPPPSWSSETPPTGPEARAEGSAAAAAKDKQEIEPVGGWEAGTSEAIHVGGKLEGEAAAMAEIKEHRSILYLAAVGGRTNGHRPIPPLEPAYVIRLHQSHRMFV